MVKAGNHNNILPTGFINDGIWEFAGDDMTKLRLKAREGQWQTQRSPNSYINGACKLKTQTR